MCKKKEKELCHQLFCVWDCLYFSSFQYRHIVSFIWVKEIVPCEGRVTEHTLFVPLKWIFEHFGENRFAVMNYVIKMLDENK